MNDQNILIIQMNKSFSDYKSEGFFIFFFSLPFLDVNF